MERLSVIDKFNILKELISGQLELMIVFIFFIILGILLFASSKADTKRYLKGYLLIYTIIIVALIIGFHVDLYKLIDYLINNVFYYLVFPNFVVYTIIIIIANILLLTGILKEKIPLLKVINIIFYSLIGYLTFIVLNVIKINKIDVYSALDIYSNESLYASIQITMIIFWIWIILRLIIKIIKKNILNKADIQIDITDTINTPPETTFELNSDLEEEKNQENIFEDNYIEPSINKQIILPEYQPIEEKIPVQEEIKENNDKIEISLTKEEWIGLNDILKREQYNNYKR